MSVNTYKINYLSTIVPYRRYNREMKTLANSVNFDKNDAGKFRLKVIKHAEKYGWRSTCDAYGISKSSYYRWKKLLFNSRGKLSSLIPRKTTPKRVRQPVTNRLLLSKIKQIRSKRGNLGKDKIKVQLDEYAHRLGIASISATTIGRVIKRYHLYQKPYRHMKRKSKYAKNRVKAAPRIKVPGFIEVDCVTCNIFGKRYYFVSLIDIYTKMASVALLLSVPSSQATRNALISFQEKLTYPIVKVQTDNGLGISW